MELLTQELLSKLPPLYSQENEPDPLVICKFFHPNSYWTWYATEYDPKKELFFGWVYGDFPELGYFSLAEMEAFQDQLGLGIERDLHFSPMRLSEVKKLHEDMPSTSPRTITIYIIDNLEGEDKDSEY